MTRKFYQEEMDVVVCVGKLLQLGISLPQISKLPLQVLY